MAQTHCHFFYRDSTLKKSNFLQIKSHAFFQIELNAKYGKYVHWPPLFFCQEALRQFELVEIGTHHFLV